MLCGALWNHIKLQNKVLHGSKMISSFFHLHQSLVTIFKMPRQNRGSNIEPNSANTHKQPLPSFFFPSYTIPHRRRQAAGDQTRYSSTTSSSLVTTIPTSSDATSKFPESQSYLNKVCQPPDLVLKWVCDVNPSKRSVFYRAYLDLITSNLRRVVRSVLWWQKQMTNTWSLSIQLLWGIHSKTI